MSEKYREMGSQADGMKTPSEAVSGVVPEWEKLRTDASGVTFVWCLLESDGKYRVVESGGGGVSEACKPPQSRTDTVWFGGLRVTRRGEGGGSAPPKFIHVLCVPSAVSPLKRGKAQLQKAAIFNAWPGASGEVSLTDMDESSLRGAVAKLLRCQPDDLE